MVIHMETKKVARAVTIIGGAGGPTSVFLVGKGQRDKNPLRRIQQAVRAGRAKRRRRLAEKKITAGAHSLEETICYIREKYGAVEADAALPEEAFPIDYHLYLIDRGQDGKMEIETESKRGIFSVSYSGNRKAMDRIEKDIYLFYGVSQEDIAGKTERYRTLVNILSEL